MRMDLEISVQRDQKIAWSLAVSTAIKSGVRLMQDDMRSLIDQLFACEEPAITPIGRRCFDVLELTELHRRFKS